MTATDRWSSYQDDFVAMGRVFVDPRATFRSFHDRSPILVPWIVVSVVSVVLGLLMLSITQRAMVEVTTGLPASPSLDLAATQLDRMKWITIGVTPGGVLARWVLATLLLWAPATLLSKPAPWKPLLSIIAFSSLPLILGKGLDLTVHWFQGPEFTTNLTPVFESASSLRSWFPEKNVGPWAHAFASTLTPFGVWSLALWILGLRVRLRWPAGTATSLGAFVGITLWSVAASLERLSSSLASSAWAPPS